MTSTGVRGEGKATRHTSTHASSTTKHAKQLAEVNASHTTHTSSTTGEGRTRFGIIGINTHINELSLLRIRQQLIRLIDILELLFGLFLRLFIRVRHTIRMVLESHLTISLLDCIICCITVHIQDLVVVLLTGVLNQAIALLNFIVQINVHVDSSKVILQLVQILNSILQAVLVTHGFVDTNTSQVGLVVGLIQTSQFINTELVLTYEMDLLAKRKAFSLSLKDM